MPLSRISAKVIFWVRSVIAHNLADRGEGETAGFAAAIAKTRLLFPNFFPPAVGRR
jgi:hypothetical protein